MILEPLIASIAIALLSIMGVFFFGKNQKLTGVYKYFIPIAVGVFLSLIFFELIPETLASSPKYGSLFIVFGYIGFYILANILHRKYHHLEEEGCENKSSAMLLLIRDAVHNMADGVILGGAFLIDPTVGIATAVGLALHEIPQEIVELGVLIQAGYSRTKAVLYNLLSASSIILGTLLILLFAKHSHEYIWVLTAVAAGNLLFLATSDLLPRIHGNLKNYGSIWNSALSITLGFLVMTGVLTWTHERFGHGHVHDDHHHENHIEPHHVNDHYEDHHEEHE